MHIIKEISRQNIVLELSFKRIRVLEVMFFPKFNQLRNDKENKSSASCVAFRSELIGFVVQKKLPQLEEPMHLLYTY